MSSVFFTSDTHFGHRNIIKYCNRPFADTNEMDRILIENWNEVVGQRDTIYHLGDFSMGNQAPKILPRLNGNKILIKGNHDKRPRLEHGWSEIENYKELKYDGQLVILFHYAMRVWNRSHRGSWMLYGHSHNTLFNDPTLLSIDVGVDCQNYRPVSFDEVRRIMAKKTWVSPLEKNIISSL